MEFDFSEWIGRLVKIVSLVYVPKDLGYVLHAHDYGVPAVSHYGCEVVFVSSDEVFGDITDGQGSIPYEAMQFVEDRAEPLVCTVFLRHQRSTVAVGVIEEIEGEMVVELVSDGLDADFLVRKGEHPCVLLDFSASL